MTVEVANEISNIVAGSQAIIQNIISQPKSVREEIIRIELTVISINFNSNILIPKCQSSTTKHMLDVSNKTTYQNDCYKNIYRKGSKKVRYGI